MTNSEGMVSSAIQTVDAAGNSIPVPVITSKAKGKKLSLNYKGDGYTQAAKSTVKVPKK